MKILLFLLLVVVILLVTWLEGLGELCLVGTVSRAGCEVTELAGADIGDGQAADQDPSLLHLALPGVHLHLQVVRLTDNNQAGTPGLFGLLPVLSSHLDLQSVKPGVQARWLHPSRWLLLPSLRNLQGRVRA